MADISTSSLATTSDATSVNEAVINDEIYSTLIPSSPSRRHRANHEIMTRLNQYHKTAQTIDHIFAPTDKALIRVFEDFEPGKLTRVRSVLGPLAAFLDVLKTDPAFESERRGMTDEVKMKMKAFEEVILRGAKKYEMMVRILEVVRLYFGEFVGRGGGEVAGFVEGVLGAEVGDVGRRREAVVRDGGERELGDVKRWLLLLPLGGSGDGGYANVEVAMMVHDLIAALEV